MIAVAGGLGAALAWAAAALFSARASRAIGVSSTLAWVMLVGLAVALPAVLLAGGRAPDGGALGWVAGSGIGNVVGLGLIYAAFRRGKVGVVTPIASTEGAVAAVIAVALGERLAPGVGAALGVVGIGVVLAATARGSEGRTSTRVIGAGLAEVVGFASYAVGARHGIAIAAVLASQFAAVAALGALVLYRERLTRAQVVGIAVIAVGVAALSALRA